MRVPTFRPPLATAWYPMKLPATRPVCPSGCHELKPGKEEPVRSRLRLVPRDTHDAECMRCRKRFRAEVRPKGQIIRYVEVPE